MEDFDTLEPDQITGRVQLFYNKFAFIFYTHTFDIRQYLLLYYTRSELLLISELKEVSPVGSLRSFRAMLETRRQFVRQLAEKQNFRYRFYGTGSSVC